MDFIHPLQVEHWNQFAIPFKKIHMLYNVYVSYGT